MKIRSICLFAVIMTAAMALAQAQARPAITGIAFARVYAAQPDASVAFYKTLGFVPETVGTLTRFAVNEAQWFEVEPLPQPAPASRWDAVGYTTTDVNAMQRYLQSTGFAITSPLKDHIFGVQDPEGNRLYFVQAGSYKRSAAQIANHQQSANRIIHTGILVRDPHAEDAFYRDILGFRPYWHGGATDDRTDYISQQVPDGTDWLEYMLNRPATPTLQQFGGTNHISLGVEHMADAIASLKISHCVGENCSKTKFGRDGKVQMNLFDPDLTRFEYMEFKPSGTTCCSAFTAKHPDPSDPK